MRNVAESGIVGTCALSARGDRGVILLVVLGIFSQLLTLIGLTFVQFASHGGPVDAIERVEQDLRWSPGRSHGAPRESGRRAPTGVGAYERRPGAPGIVCDHGRIGDADT